MLLSLYSPCHNSEYLRETWFSIQAQKPVPFEWIIVPNKGAVVPPDIAQDPRVKIVSPGPEITNIGALKRLACEHCQGDVLVEMDSDDLLAPGIAFQAIADAYLAGGEYIYSDSAVFKYPSLDTHGYSPEYGWHPYPVEVYGRKLLASRVPEILPDSLVSIYLSPDHVRCQRHGTYLRVGGYDATLPIIEDHDLMCRFYLAGAKFQHTGGCHYLYRMHVNNSCRVRGDQVQNLTSMTGYKYFKPMVFEWLRRTGAGYADLAVWRRNRWGFGDPIGKDKFGVLECNDILQYCPPETLPRFFNNCWEALTPGGYLLLRVPNAASNSGDYDPAAKSRFNLGSFLFYTRREYAARLPGVRCRFREVHMYNEPQNRVQRQYHLRDLNVHLVALKGQPHPGSEYI
jgi:glycosyltransferase involved in cell wall biosynthesis